MVKRAFSVSYTNDDGALDSSGFVSSSSKIKRLVEIANETIQRRNRNFSGEVSAENIYCIVYAADREGEPAKRAILSPVVLDNLFN